MSSVPRVFPVAALLAVSCFLIVSSLVAAEPTTTPIPSPTFTDKSLGEQYTQGVELLKNSDYKAAKRTFSRIKSKVAAGAEREAVTRCLRECAGGLEIKKIEGQFEKGRLHKALAKLDKVAPKFAKTLVGDEMVLLRAKIANDLYQIVQDFEDKPAPAEGRPPMRRAGFGQRSKVINGTVKEGTVRQGVRALEWRTGKNVSNVAFKIEDFSVSEYRYVLFSLRCKDPKMRPQIDVLFDADEGWGLSGEGGMWGGSRVGSRMGYHYNMVPDGKWQDVRIDLKKFVKKGDINWDDVHSLTLVHLAGVESTLIIDNLRLEK